MATPAPSPGSPDTDSFRDHIPTVDASGQRVWIYPKRPSGRFYRARTWVSWVALAVMFAGPFVRIQGQPLLLLNVVERKFSILGQVFWPQDLYLFALTMVAGFVMVVLFTAVFGRVWCGWLCPQTVMMEMVFRKIEYWLEGDAPAQRALDAAPWSAAKVARKGTKHAIFFALSFLVGNTLLAYVIGSEALAALVTEPPTDHPTGFVAMCLFALLFYGIFARFREQACTFICPYGRFQSVLLDDNTIVVAYDSPRGEPRGKVVRDEAHAARRARGGGDCVGCNACVHVCPTGIDIRNGTQMECVNCTACIDACDAVMDRLGFPRGLVRFASLRGIREGAPLRFTPRLAGYCTLLVALAALIGFLLLTRADVQATLLRTPGALYQVLPDGSVSNLYQVKMTNKTVHPMPIDLRLAGARGTITVPGGPMTLAPQTLRESVAIVTLPAGAGRGQQPLAIEIWSGGQHVDTVRTVFLGPDAAAPVEGAR